MTMRVAPFPARASTVDEPGEMHHPVYLELRTDKRAEEVTRERENSVKNVYEIRSDFDYYEVKWRLG